MTTSGRVSDLQPPDYTDRHTHTHPFNGRFSGTTRVSRYHKGKPIWILLKQHTVSGSGISWAICKSAPRSRQITTPAPHHSVFLQAGCASCRPTNSVKALKTVHRQTDRLTVAQQQRSGDNLVDVVLVGNVVKRNVQLVQHLHHLHTTISHSLTHHLSKMAARRSG